MDPAFGFNERAGEKQVHQHGLAAPHVPMHVKAPRRRAGLAAPDEELVEKATALRSPCHKIRVQAVEAAHHRLLRRVGLEVTARTQRLVSGEGTSPASASEGCSKRIEFLSWAVTYITRVLTSQPKFRWWVRLNSLSCRYFVVRLGGAGI